MKGICPNTGEVCEKLLEADKIRHEHIDASPSPFLPGAWHGLNDKERDAYNRNLQEGIQALKLLGKAEKGSCIGGCVLAGINVVSFISESDNK